MFAGHPCEIFLIKKQLFSRKMLNKRKLKYNFGTECILLKTVYNNQNIFMLKQKSEIYIWFKSAFFTNGVGPTSLGSHPLIIPGILISIMMMMMMVTMTMTMMMMMMIMTLATLAATQCREYLLLIEERPSWQLTFQQFTICDDGVEDNGDGDVYFEDDYHWTRSSKTLNWLRRGLSWQLTFPHFTMGGDGGEDNGDGDGDGGHYDSVDGYLGDDNAETIYS